MGIVSSGVFLLRAPELLFVSQSYVYVNVSVSMD